MMLQQNQLCPVLALSYVEGVMIGVANRSKAEIMPGVRGNAVTDPKETSESDRLLRPSE